MLKKQLKCIFSLFTQKTPGLKTAPVVFYCLLQLFFTSLAGKRLYLPHYNCRLLNCFRCCFAVNNLLLSPWQFTFWGNLSPLMRNKPAGFPLHQQQFWHEYFGI
jgi:hypothetical protein